MVSCKMRSRLLRTGAVALALTATVLLSYWNTLFTSHWDLRSGVPLNVPSIDCLMNSTLLKYNRLHRNSNSNSNSQPKVTDRATATSTPAPSQVAQVLFDAQEGCWASRSLTVVSGYFNIGAFPKGSMHNARDHSAYLRWLRGITTLGNPIVFFTDDARVKSAFELWRNDSGNVPLCSRTYLVSRDDLWPWRLLQNMTVALRSKAYKFSPPCTTNPAYNAATNSKYPLTELAILLNPFRTRYFAWLDAGIYRSVDLPNSQLYCVEPLPDLPPNLVGYLEIRRKPITSAAQIFLQHVDWLAGGVFFGLRKPMLALTREYSRFAQIYISKQLVGADQQVLAAMFASADRHQNENENEDEDDDVHVGKPSVSLRLYNPYPTLLADPWFHLAFRMRSVCKVEPE